ncbi:hypothetical protein LCGC14_3013810, partial [marine sediment metagenome]
MPVYVYQCSGCSARWEEFHTVAERHAEAILSRAAAIVAVKEVDAEAHYLRFRRATIWAADVAA